MDARTIQGIEIVKLDDRQKSDFIKTYKDAPYNAMNDFYALIFNSEYIGGLVLEHDLDDNIKQIYEKSKLSPEGFVSFFYVCEPFRKLRLGARLFSIILGKYKKIGLATENKPNHQVAADWYTRLGFKPIHTEEKFTYWHLDH